MKIVCVSGAQVPSEKANSLQVMKVCQALVQLGHGVTLIVPRQLPDLQPFAFRLEEPSAAAQGKPSTSNFQPSTLDLQQHYGLRASFPIECLPAHSRRMFFMQAVRRARALHPDVLYTRTLPAAVFGLLHHLPVILELHELPSGRFGPLWYHLFLRLPGKKRLLCITHALQQRLARNYRPTLPPEQVLIAPDGVDLERFANLPDPGTARRQLGLPPVPTVACTGHLYTGRGAALFLALAEKFPKVNFLWAGGQPQDVDEWRARAAAQGLTNVTFSGFIPNERLPLYQASADVLLLLYERRVSGSSGGDIAAVFSPLKMFEYMAAGRAILASDLPALREVLNEANAAFCPPEDAQAWRAALISLLKDEKRRQSLGRCARADVEKYTWEARVRRSLEGFVE